MDIKSFKILVDKELKSLLDNKIRNIDKIVDNDRIRKIYKYINIFLDKGKRVRPYLVYITYKAFGGKHDKDILRYSLGFELYHNFALIHDDIIDKGDKRHGVDCFHLYCSDLYNKKHAEIGVSQAIIVGDVLISRANETIFGDYSFDRQLLATSQQNYNQMCDEITLGQILDIDITGSEHVDEKLLKLKNYYKTASYTFIRPMKSGAMLVSKNNEIFDQLEKLGEYLGQAYQIKDDISDIIIEESDKTYFSDIQEGQQTFITDYIFQYGNPLDQKIVRNCLGKKLNGNQILRLQQIFVNSGAIDHGRMLVGDYLEKAKKILNLIDFIDENYKPYFEDIIVSLKI